MRSKEKVYTQAEKAERIVTSQVRNGFESLKKADTCAKASVEHLCQGNYGLAESLACLAGYYREAAKWCFDDATAHISEVLP